MMILKYQQIDYKKQNRNKEDFKRDLNNYKDLLNEASELYNKIPKKEKTLIIQTKFKH